MADGNGGKVWCPGPCRLTPLASGPRLLPRPLSSGRSRAGLSRLAEKEAEGSARRPRRWRARRRVALQMWQHLGPAPTLLGPGLDPRQGVSAVPYPEL